MGKDGDSAHREVRPPSDTIHGDRAPWLQYNGDRASRPARGGQAYNRKVPNDGGGTSKTRPPGAATAGTTQKSKNCKTNPILCKPAWKIVGAKAKNEPICRIRQRRLVRLGFATFRSVGGVKKACFWGSCGGILRTECRESDGYFIARKCVDRVGVFGRMRQAFPPLIWKVGSCL
jgi:hypothetical protein